MLWKSWIVFFASRPDMLERPTRASGPASQLINLTKCDWFSCWRFSRSNGVTYGILPGPSKRASNLWIQRVGSHLIHRSKSCTCRRCASCVMRLAIIRSEMIDQQSDPTIAPTKTGEVTHDCPPLPESGSLDTKFDAVEKEILSHKTLRPVSQRFSAQDDSLAQVWFHLRVMSDISVTESDRPFPSDSWQILLELQLFFGGFVKPI